MGAWVVCRYQDCENLLRDKRLGKDFTKSARLARFVDSFEGETPPFLRLAFGPEARSFLLTDPPVHTARRNLIGKAFTPGMVRGLTEPLDALVRELLDVLPGSFDLVDSLAAPLPGRLLALLLDLPRADHERFSGWMADVAGLLDLDFAVPVEVVARRWQAVREAGAYLLRLVASRRAGDGTDLISELIRARHEGDALGADDIAATCVMLMVATQRAVTNLIGNAGSVLARRPEVFRRLYDEPDLVDDAVDEIIRLEPPTHGAGRVARERIALHDAVIEPGDMVMFLIGSANRDERRFEDPDSFLLNRPSRGHLGFSAGAHYCLGAPLARLLARQVLLGWTREFSSMSLDGEHISFGDGIGVRGPTRLDVSVRRRPS